MQDIGDEHGITRERTRQVEKKAIKKIERRLELLLKYGPGHLKHLEGNKEIDQEKLAEFLDT